MKKLTQCSALLLLVFTPALALASVNVCLKLINGSTNKQHIVMTNLNGHNHTLKSGESYGFASIESDNDVVVVPFTYEDGLTGTLLVTSSGVQLENSDMGKTVTLRYQTFPTVSCGKAGSRQRDLKGYGVYLTR